MADREKLIELVHEGEQQCSKISCRNCEHFAKLAKCKANMIADRLIANGVTVRERGRWIPHYETFDEDAAVGILGGTYQTGWQCSVCGRYEPGKEPYCNCGADMRPKGEGEEDG